jgi:tRNA threonylcarbamoyladenosine biosynthesis protein TsaE
LIRRTRSPRETEALGGELASGLAPGDVVLVRGELGAGKTTLIRGACRALGVSGPVVSPTFTVGRRYRGSEVAVSHLDLYRLGELEAEEPGILDDYLTADAIAFIEWPGAAEPALEREGDDSPRIAVRVELRHAGGDEREALVNREGS